MLTVELRRQLKNRCDRAPFIEKPPGGEVKPPPGGGVAEQRQGGLGCTCTWLSIGFLLKVDSNEWEKSTFPAFSTFFAEMASAKAQLLSIQTPRARASAKFQFPCFTLVSYRSFDEFSQKLIIFILLGKETFFTTFSPKIPF